MVPDLTKSSLGLEYFCFEGDGLWSMTDEQLIALGTKEIAQIGLVDSSRIVDGCVVRMPKAYPVYDDEYQQNVSIIRRWLSNLENLQVAGRNGMHKYNNQDHSMMTALLAARNIMGAGPFDPWCVNTDAEYHEEKMDDPAENKAVGRIVPQKLVAGT
ncbi:MAG: FAD-dependent oxidoreductase, partial [bacterium]